MEFMITFTTVHICDLARNAYDERNYRKLLHHNKRHSPYQEQRTQHTHLFPIINFDHVLTYFTLSIKKIKDHMVIRLYVRRVKDGYVLVCVCVCVCLSVRPSVCLSVRLPACLPA